MHVPLRTAMFVYLSNVSSRRAADDIGWLGWGARHVLLLLPQFQLQQVYQSDRWLKKKKKDAKWETGGTEAVT